MNVYVYLILRYVSQILNLIQEKKIPPTQTRITIIYTVERIFKRLRWSLYIKWYNKLFEDQHYWFHKMSELVPIFRTIQSFESWEFQFVI